MMRVLVLCLISCFLFSNFADAGQIVRVIRRGNQFEALSADAVNSEPHSPQTIRSLPKSLREDAPASEEIYEEILVSDSNFETSGLKGDLQKLAGLFRRKWVGSEVKVLINQGPKENRINLTIVGDGYTESEKEKFFADAERTARGLFDGETFHSYLPLFNVYAVFVPSKESGLSDRTKVDTALGLYRDPPGSKRAIMVGKSDEARRAVALAPATDYSILLANDDFYGGLGGEFAVTTRSVKTGMIVLRHELGHNFSNVGEEYDGGYVYRGANFSSSASADWARWAQKNEVKAFESKPLFGEYLWTNLREGSYKNRFEFPQTPGWSFNFQLSSVGWSTPDDVHVFVDDKRVSLRGEFLSDRSFFYPLKPIPLVPGKHSIEIKENLVDGDNVLGSARAWGFPPDYDFTPDLIGAFATFDDSNQRVGYRPTHESCLMRNMETVKFCPVDQENMWLRFLARVALVDSLSFEIKGGVKTVALKTPPLPDLKIDWFHIDGSERKELAQFKNLREWTFDQRMKGQLVAKVSFTSPEIRKASNRLTTEVSLKIKSPDRWGFQSSY